MYHIIAMGKTIITTASASIAMNSHCMIPIRFHLPLDSKPHNIYNIKREVRGLELRPIFWSYLIVFLLLLVEWIYLLPPRSGYHTG